MRTLPIFSLTVAVLVAAPAIAQPIAQSDMAASTTETQACDRAAEYSNERRGVAVYVLRDGEPICDRGDSDEGQELWSGTKSFVGLIAAAAVQDGLLTLDERVSETITEWADDPRRRTITWRQLLSMTSGHKSTLGRPPSYRRSIRADLTAEPGTRFQYGPTPMQIFGEAFSRKLKAAGLDDNPVDYLDRRILRPAGVEYSRWRDDGGGNPLLAQGAIMTAREWAEFGEFVRGGARVDGKQIVDGETFDALFKGSAINPNYGLTWWLPGDNPQPGDPITAATDLGTRADEYPADTAIAAGAGNQRLYVIPSQRLTIVRQAKIDLVGMLLGRKPENPWSDADFLGFFIQDGPAR